ncbi:MAG: DNA-3-methyladenine glycosylase [Alphaproteobacteria bacterium]|nr:DNA-3-methyladenine glycosylase [Alphaproteobacteria bacterium]MBL7097035.1 DNA-3-methyladenine glycosylase [Alphaproteobacteria bacterium]
MKPIGPRFFARDADAVARALIGTTLMFGKSGGIIVETEAYDTTDPASHSYGERQTRRNAVMFGAPGHAYVYFIYGVHWCLNFVCKDASAVLIRALEPTHGLAAMARRRGNDDPRKLCSGPGKLCEALGITGVHNGLSLFAPPLALINRSRRPAIATGVRIGLTKAADLPRRYGLANSPHLSRGFPELPI